MLILPNKMKVILLCVFAISGTLAGSYHTVDMEDIVGPNIPKTIFSISNSNSPIKKVYSEQELKVCKEMFGKYLDGVFVGIPTNCTMEKILEGLGGFPGKVNVTQRTNVPVAPIGDPNKRPLPDAAEPFWLYSYNVTDYKTYLRVEHAIKRFAGTPKEFLDIRGVMAWLQPDFCGQLRVADYHVDDTGFHATLDEVACLLYEEPKPILACKRPPRCKTQNKKVVCP